MLHLKKMKPQQIHVAEIVLFESNNLKQKDWPLTKIEKNFPGKDGNTRLVELKSARENYYNPFNKCIHLKSFIWNITMMMDVRTRTTNL